MSTIVPMLKDSLSSALQHYFPLTSRLATCSSRLVLLSSNKDKDDDSSIPFKVVVAETNSEFEYLWSNKPRDASIFHQLVPHLNLNPLSVADSQSDPLFAIQITYFPNNSNSNSNSNANNVAHFSIGIACHPVICDQRTFHLFLSTWASYCKLGQLIHIQNPSFDRSVIVDPTNMDLNSLLFKQYLHSLSLSTIDNPIPIPIGNDHGMVRSTFVMTPSHIDNSRLWIQAQCHKTNTPYPVLLSPYIVTCALLWTCLARAHNHHSNVNPLMYLGFIAGGITRLPYLVPTNYFGNCVAFGRAVANREDLLKEDGMGILAAAHSMAKAIKDLDAHVLGQAHNWIPDCLGFESSDLHINVVGSPKVELYKTDFGWGTPKKIEEISTDTTITKRGISISLMETRDVKGGIEIGLTLPNSTMLAFSSLFYHALTFTFMSSSLL